MAPHSAVGGTAPSPRNESPAKMRMALPRSSVTSTISGPIAFGMMCRTGCAPGRSRSPRRLDVFLVALRPAPGCGRGARISATTRPAWRCMVFTVPMPSAAAMAMARMIGGKQQTRSVRRISASSGQRRRIGGDAAEQRAEQRAEQHHGEAHRRAKCARRGSGATARPAPACPCRANAPPRAAAAAPRHRRSSGRYGVISGASRGQQHPEQMMAPPNRRQPVAPQPAPRCAARRDWRGSGDRGGIAHRFATRGSSSA